MSKRYAYIVTSPDVEVGYEELGPALSRAVTEATRVRREITVYVRDRAGSIVGYAESDEHGAVIVVRR